MPSLLIVCTALLSLGQSRPAPTHSPGRLADQSSPGGILKIARSLDGLTFTEDPIALAATAHSPFLERLPNGQLLLLFEQTTGPDSKQRSTIMASRSTDQGRSWSKPRQINIVNEQGQSVEAHYPNLVRAGRRHYRMIFCTPGSNGSSTVIGSASTRNGLDYVLDSVIDEPIPPGVNVQPLLACWDDLVHLYVSTTLARSDQSKETLRRTAQFVSKDGRRFEAATPPRLSKRWKLGSIVKTDEGLRAYGTSQDGVISLRSRDGLTFEEEAGVRLPKACSPTAIQFRNGSTLMAYCAKPAKKSAQKLVMASWSGHDFSPGADVDILGNALSAGSDDLNIPPQANFEDPVDYVDWYTQTAQLGGTDNAFDAYAEFMPMPWNDDQVSADWPDLNNMFTDKTRQGPPGPWDVHDHPGWEQSNRQVQGLLESFRDASWSEDYSMPPLFGNEPPGQAGEDEPLLIDMRIPHLSSHRQLARATLADAWRTREDGTVSPERMLDAFETTLRNAKHLTEGSTLIENLVGAAESKLVHKNALSALQHGLFDARGLEEALDILLENDRDDSDPVRFLRAEQAVSMQLTQRLFSPKYSEESRIETAQKMLGAIGGNEQAVEQITSLSLADAQAATQAFGDYYTEVADQFNTGYPAVRSADIQSTADRYVHTNALTEALLPSLSRVHKLRTRADASRRATQLAYATHLFKARNGHWPESLDDLPERIGDQARTDPFTGQDFMYRVDDNGPTIYSSSENGVDDGGIHSPSWDDSIDGGTESDDYVFWPPPEEEN